MSSIALLLAAVFLASPQDAGPRLGRYHSTIAESLRGSRGAAFGTEGLIYIADTANHRVAVFDRRGVFQRQWPETPSTTSASPGEFLEPSDVAVASDGLVFVLDTGNARVQSFHREGTFIRQFGSYGHGDGQLCQPRGLAVDTKHIYVADSGNDRVLVFDRVGTLQRSIGSFGREPGRFNRPLDVAVDPGGSVFVADTANHRIQIFSPEGVHLVSFGEWGSGPGFFAEPTSLTIADGRLFVADSRNHRVQVFDLDAVDFSAPPPHVPPPFLYRWGMHAVVPHEGEGALHYPDCIAIAPSMRQPLALVCESFEDRVQLFSLFPADATEQDLNPRWWQNDPAEHFGSHIDASASLLACADPDGQSIKLFDNSGEEPILITTIASFGIRPGQVNLPDGVALDEGRNLLYVADAGNRRIAVFQLNRPQGEIRFVPGMAQFIRALDLSLLHVEGAAVVQRPCAIRRHPSGDLYVIDTDRAVISVFSPDLEHRRSFGGYGASPGSFRKPTDLAFSTDSDTLFVVDSLNHRIQTLDLHGQHRFAIDRTACDPPMQQPFGIAIDRNNVLFVSDELAHRFVKFDEKGSFLASIGSPGLERGELFKPRGIAVDHTGRVIVNDWGNHRLQYFTGEGEFLLYFGGYLLPEQPADVD